MSFKLVSIVVAFAFSIVIFSLILSAKTTNDLNLIVRSSMFLFGNCSYVSPSIPCDINVIYLCIEQQALYNCNSTWNIFFQISISNYGNAYSYTVMFDKQPACGESKVIKIQNTAWISNGMVIYVEGGGFYIVLNVIDSTSLTITNPCFTPNVLPNTMIPFNTLVSPGGQQGLNGPSGASGEFGSSGASGSSGSTGSSGASGTSGYTGATGTSGSTGATGASGSSGSTGSTGASGSTGTTGTSGSIGSTGSFGSSGPTGASGTGNISPCSPLVCSPTIGSQITLPFSTTNSIYYAVSSLNGNKYAAGYTGSSPYNGLVVKFDCNDNITWYNQVTSNSFIYFTGVSSSSDNNVYAVGYLQGTNNFGNNMSITAPINSNLVGFIVIAKYNSSGSLEWVKTTTTVTDNSIYQGVSVANNDDIYAVGYIYTNKSYDFGNNVIVQGGYNCSNCYSYSVLIVKYNSSGFAQWGRTATGNGPSSRSNYNGVAIGPDGSVYAAGQFFTGVIHNLGNGVFLTPTGSSVPGLVKYSSSGTTLWASTITNGTNDFGYTAVSVSTDGYIYAAGIMNAFSAGGSVVATNFGNGVVLSGPYPQNVLIVKYNASGIIQWGKSNYGSIISTNYAQFIGVSVACDGSVFAVGYIIYNTNYNFGDGVIISGAVNSYNTIIVKYSSSGTTLWAKTIVSGSSYSLSNAVSADFSSGYIYSAGYLGGTGYNFGANITDIGTYSAGYNRFLVKYSPN